MIRIHKEGYIPGTYTREVLRGYLQFHHWGCYTTTKDLIISADRTRGARLFCDSVADEWFEKGIWDKEHYTSYMKAFEAFFDFERLADQTGVQILFQLDQLRKRFIDYQAFEKVLQWRRGKFLRPIRFSGLVEEGDDPYFNRKLEADDRIHVLNAQSCERIRQTVGACERWVVFADTHRDLKTCLNLLGPLGDKREIVLFVKSNPLINELSCPDFNLKGVSPDDAQIRIEMCSANNAGFDLRDPSLQEKLIPYLNASMPILVAGEQAVLTFEGATFEYAVFLPLLTDPSCQYAGLLPSFQPHTVRTVIKSVQPVWDYPFEKVFTGVERSTYTLISNVEHERTAYMNLYSPTYMPESFGEFQIHAHHWDDIMAEREQNLFNLISRHYGDQVRCIHQRYLQSDGAPIRFDGVVFNHSKELSGPFGQIEPVLAQTLGRELIDIRKFAKTTPSEKPLFLVNFLYFATQKLLGLHNHQRSPQEKLTTESFYIDALYDASTNRASFPLYNKAFVALTKEGRLEFGNQSLKSGTLRLNAFDFSWDEWAVNSLEERDFILYTPHLSSQDINDYHGDFHTYQKDVGDGRINLLIVNDRLIAARKGAMDLSPFGVICSFSAAYEQQLMEKIGLKKGHEGYFQLPATLLVHLELPENKPYRWKYSGANRLFQDGADLMISESAAKEQLTAEGWYDPLSMQTQETQVQQWVRGPRAVIGVDQQGRPFIGVFSGRTKESAGARFDEMTAILKDCIPTVKDAINLDGGASACLGLIYKGEFFEMSLPSCTQYTTTGMARPVNSLLLLSPS